MRVFICCDFLPMRRECHAERSEASHLITRRFFTSFRMTFVQNHYSVNTLENICSRSNAAVIFWINLNCRGKASLKKEKISARLINSLMKGGIFNEKRNGIKSGAVFPTNMLICILAHPPSSQMTASAWYPEEVSLEILNKPVVFVDQDGFRFNGFIGLLESHDDNIITL